MHQSGCQSVLISAVNRLWSQNLKRERGKNVNKAALAVCLIQSIYFLIEIKPQKILFDTGSAKRDFLGGARFNSENNVSLGGARFNLARLGDTVSGRL